MISETKLDYLFSDVQFCMEPYSKPYRLDRYSKVGGIILYVREGISSKVINLSWTDDKECLLVELNLWK